MVETSTGSGTLARDIVKMQAELRDVEAKFKTTPLPSLLDGHDAYRRFISEREQILSALGTMDSSKRIYGEIAPGMKETLADAVILLNPEHSSLANPEHPSLAGKIRRADSKAYEAYKAALDSAGPGKDVIITGLQAVEKSLIQQETGQARG